MSSILQARKFLFIAVLFLSVFASAQTTTTVTTECNLNNWQLLPNGNSTIAIVNGPAATSTRQGSVKFTVGQFGGTSTTNDYSDIELDFPNGIPLSSLNSLNYSTYVQA